MAVTVSGTSITFNDATVQTTAAGGVPAFLAVGSIMVLYNFSDTSYTTNATVNAANTGYVTATGGSVYGFNPLIRNGNVTVPGAGASGWGVTTAVTGTWRTLSGVHARFYDVCALTTSGYPFLAVRIA